jgi:hypothetical protein
MDQDKKLTAPFSADTIAKLNAWQQSGMFHPFTCGGDRSDAAHQAYAKEHGGDLGQLVATPNGWICPVCGYKQNWAHSFMAPPDAKS